MADEEKKEEQEDWPDWDELEFLPGIGYMRRSEIAAALKRELGEDDD